MSALSLLGFVVGYVITFPLAVMFFAWWFDRRRYAREQRIANLVFCRECGQWIDGMHTDAQLARHRDLVA